MLLIGGATIIDETWATGFQSDVAADGDIIAEV